MSTGFENLENELLIRGCTIQQAKAKAVPILLEIIAEKEGNEAKFCIQAFKEEKVNYEKRKEELERKHEECSRAIRDRQFILDKMERRLKEKESELQNREQTANKVLQAELPEARDAIRIFELFRKSTEINTVYDNTAFIYSAGKILASGGREWNDFDIQNTMDEAFEKGDKAKKVRKRI